MTIQFICEDGGGEGPIRTKTRIRKIILEHNGKKKRLSLLYLDDEGKQKLKETLSSALVRPSYSWSGLWFSKLNQIFVEVITCDEAYIIQEDGNRYQKVRINPEKGHVEDLSGGYLCQLDCRRLGEEPRVRFARNMVWPQINKSDREAK